jgi:hypothetical protein
MKTFLPKTAARSVFLVPLAFLVVTARPIGLQSQERSQPETREELLPQIPRGTVLPVRLNGALSVRNTKPGQNISARIMQDVPLPNGRKIAEGSKVVGTVVSVEPAAQGTGGKISFRFDKVITRKGELPVVTSLRALAGFVEVQEAQTPEFSPGFGTPYTWANTRQIGGDEVYGVGGPVTNQWNEQVGTAVDDGVLVHVRARPELGCRGALGAEDRLQALWVFSADACGVYGIEGVKIARAGRSEPTGEIQLSVAKGDRVVRSSSAMLLRVVR